MILRLLLSWLFLLLLFFVLCKLLRLGNLDADRRFLQIWHVLASILLIPIMYSLYTPILRLIDYILSIQRLQPIISFIMPKRAFELSFMLIVFLVTNTLFMLAGALIAGIVKWFLRNTFDLPVTWPLRILREIAKKFYTVDNEAGDPVELNERGFNVGKWFNFFRFIVLGIIGAELLLVTIEMITPLRLIKTDILADYMRKLYLLPCLSYVLLAETTFFLQGEKRFEVVSFESEGVSSKAIGSYDQLYVMLRNRFKNDLLCAERYVCLVEESVYDTLPEDLRNSAGDKAKDLESVFSLVRAQNANLSRSYDSMLVNLLQDKHVLVTDTEHGNLGPYLVAYMQFLMINGNKLLFICQNEEELLLIRDELRASFKALNGLHYIWNIEDDSVPSEKANRINILLCLAEHFNCRDSFKRWNDFLIGVHTVIVQNAVDFFTILPKCVRDTILRNLRAVCGHVQFLFISEQRSHALRIAAEQYLHGETLELYEGDSIRPLIGLLIWKTEGSPQAEIDIENPISMAMAISAVAIKNDVRDITVFAGDEPFDSYYNKLFDIQDPRNIAAGEMQLQRTLFFRPDKPLHDVEPMTFTIVADRMNNMLFAAQTWRKYGGNSYTLLNILSKPYMLREFFAENFSELINDNRNYSLLLPTRQKNVKDDLIALLLRMYEEGVEFAELMQCIEAFNLFGDSQMKSFENLLRFLYPDFSGNIVDAIKITQSVRFKTEGNGAYVVSKTVWLTDESIYRAVIDRYQIAKGVFGTQVIDLHCIKADVDNYYFPRRIVTLNHKMYQVESIQPDRSVKLTEAEPTFISEYLPIRSYRFSIAEEKKDETDSEPEAYYFGDLCLKNIVLNVQQTVHGVMILNKGNDYDPENAVTTLVYGTPLKKLLSCRHVLQITVQNLNRETDEGTEYSAEEDSAPSDMSSIYLAFVELLNGLFDTIFPTMRKSVVALAKTSFDFESATDELHRRILTQMPRLDAVDDSLTDLLPDGIYLFETSESEGRYDQLLAQANTFRDVSKMLIDYLEWVKNAPAQKNWLMHGGEAYPPFFDVESVFKILSRIVPTPTEAAGTDEDLSSFDCCTFCGKKIISHGRMLESGKDKRVMCIDCAQHVLTRNEEIFRVYRDCVKNMERYYRIKLPSNLHIKMKSAKSIRRYTKYSGDGRILGFYHPITHELWVERGGPEAYIRSTLYHELTHAWQYGSGRVRKPKKLSREVIEGHATFVEVECMRFTHHNNHARIIEKNYNARTDEYGRGFRMFTENMPSSGRLNAFEAMEAGDPVTWIPPV